MFMGWLAKLLKERSAKLTIALGQSGIIITLLLTAAFLGLIPDRNAEILAGRGA